MKRFTILYIITAFLIASGCGSSEGTVPEIDSVQVPAGEFLMGSNPDLDPAAGAGEMPQHRVFVDAFHISKYEITNDQYRDCVLGGGCDKPGLLSDYEDPDYAEHPISSVIWSEANSFCAWVGGRLPTEAEWEYAARGPEGPIYPWGDDPPTCELANFDNCFDGTTPVGSFPDGASWCGAEDMAGNVWEWVNDWYGHYPSELQTNPIGPETATMRVQRGGGWIEYMGHKLRAAIRDPDAPDDSDPSSGFRCVVPPRE